MSMKRLSLLGLAFLLLLGACDIATLGREDREEALGVYIACPGTDDTRADVGETPASTVENRVHSLTVWVFTSSDHTLVGSLDLSGNLLPRPGRVRRYEMAVSREFARMKPDVDVFALANAASVGCTLDGNSTWEAIDSALFCDPYFGVGSPVLTVNPELGLPMTGVGRNLAVQDEEPLLRVETVPLVRAVSKLRYVFCRTKTEGDAAAQQDSIRINKVTLNGNMIPVGERLFLPSADADFAIAPGGYDIRPYDTFGPAWLARNETPEKLIYAGQDPASYESMLDRAVEEGTLSDWGVTYLRESDKMLSGYVEYVVNGETRTRNFTMASPGDFARNHTWTLYGYFLSGRNLQLSVRVLNWDYNSWLINFSDHAVVAQQLLVAQNTVELTETSKDHFDARLRPGTAAQCRLYITSPATGKLLIRPSGDTYAFLVSPQTVDINPEVNAGLVEIEIRRNPAATGNLSGKFITLSFYVELGDREIDANTEILNGKEYRFIL